MRGVKQDSEHEGLDLVFNALSILFIMDFFCTSFEFFKYCINIIIAMPNLGS